SWAIGLYEIRQAANAQRVAATVFECQEGMIVTDADGRILRVNKSFTRIMGYDESEVLGETTGFMHSGRHPASYYENAWRMTREHGVWAHETWHRRKNGEVFPQWLTSTAVQDSAGRTTNYVITHTDISYRKKKEAALQTRQAQQRDALVREVHHRIKNNLQGITGLL
ncbi:PAS domain S-box protein, partial [Leptospira sp. SA-E8]|uniref:PAS domain-containing protein n=1 Tax=Leptospira sp. SA-E8 TaxID=3422259 RepID=UPI003EBC7014